MIKLSVWMDVLNLESFKNSGGVEMLRDISGDPELDVFSVLGQGAFGIVFSAIYMKMNVAIKIVREIDILDEFIQEAIDDKTGECELAVEMGEKEIGPEVYLFDVRCYVIHEDVNVVRSIIIMEKFTCSLTKFLMDEGYSKIKMY